MGWTGMGEPDGLTTGSAHSAEDPSCFAENRGSEAPPVVVAVDMSACSRAALVWACEYADAADQPVIVLHVLHDAPNAPGKYRNGADPLAPMRDTAERMLADFVAETRAQHPKLKPLTSAATQLIEGLPAARIVERAIQLKADLVVLGSPGQTGGPRLLNQSVAKKVARLSPIPVTVVKAER